MTDTVCGCHYDDSVVKAQELIRGTRYTRKRLKSARSGMSYSGKLEHRIARCQRGFRMTTSTEAFVKKENTGLRVKIEGYHVRDPDEQSLGSL